MRLKNKVAILAGVGERSSRATAVLFAEEGAKVVLAARRLEYISETADTINEMGGQVTVIQGDVTVSDDANLIVETAVETYGGIDIIYNNVSGAFASQGQRLHEIDFDDWRMILDGILNSAYLISKAGLPFLLKNGKGVILFVAASENVQLMGNAAYGAGKAGITQLTKNMAREYIGDKIRVNCISPGFMQLKPWLERDVNSSTDALYRDGDLQKRHGLPEDIAFAATYLASDEANWVTGQTLILDGGDDILSRREIPPAA